MGNFLYSMLVCSVFSFDFKFFFLDIRTRLMTTGVDGWELKTRNDTKKQSVKR